jgi:hypothetical protein
MTKPKESPEAITPTFLVDAFCAATAITFTILLLQDALLYI